jgi:anti-anti-sigma factor
VIAITGHERRNGPVDSRQRFAVSAEKPGFGVPRVSVQGEIDIATVDLVRRHAHRQIELDGPSLVLDLAHTGFMDSSGLHLIEGLRRRTSERGGALVVVVATYGVRRLLEIAPPCSDVRVVVVPSQRDAVVRSQRLWTDRGRVAVA